MKDTLIKALKEGGKTLLDYFEKPLSVNLKESQSSIVTVADFASDSAITKMIREKFPEHNIISEETGFTNNNSEYTWIIDPLDGTSNFASGIPWFGVLISILKNNIPVMGGAFLPVENAVYFAEKGNGAFKNGKLMPKLKNKELKNSLFSFCVDYTDDISFLNKGIEIYKYLVRGSRNIRSTNSLVDFIYVAEGKFGGVLNLYTKIWDIAGLGLIINEAGGTIQNADGSDLKFDLSKEILNVNFPVFAGNRKIAETLNTDILKL